MIPEINAILQDFLKDVERAEHLLKLINHLRAFGASAVPQEVSGGSVVWSESIELKEAAKTCRTDLPIFSGSLLLYVSGRFEYFARRAMQAATEVIVSRIGKYSDLPSKIRKEIRFRTFEAFQHPGRYGYTEAQVDMFAINLASNLSNPSQAPRINADVLTHTETNMNSEAFSDLMKRIEMKEVWSDIGKQAKIKLHLEVSSDKDSISAAKSLLDAIMEERNQIAHPTATTTFPDPDKVIKYTLFLKVLASVIAEIVCVNLTSPAVPAQAP